MPNPAVTSGNGAIDSKVALRSAIFEERAKELALEGDRRWDLIRWGLYLDVMNSIGGTNEDGTKTNYDEASVNKHREAKHLLFPIPSPRFRPTMPLTATTRAGAKHIEKELSYNQKINRI